MRRKIAFLIIVTCLILLTTASGALLNLSNPLRIILNSLIQADDLDAIPANQWVQYYQPFYASWQRQSHAGIAYDTNRGVFYVFGSDTHGLNWDNSVHEFNPSKKAWITHYAPTAKSSYRVDHRGVGVSGDSEVLPWAMHTFDNVIYDPLNDALAITAIPSHNPITKDLDSKPNVHPTWFYHVPTNLWLNQEQYKQAYPGNFAGSSTYDTRRDVIVSYGSGMWELGPDRQVWKKVKVSKPHQIHHSMAYDPLNHQIAVFGDYSNSNDVWIYTPGSFAGSAGSWDKRTPKGDYCPPDQTIPVAFDKKSGVYLLVVNNEKNSSTATNDSMRDSSSTFIYDPIENTYRKLPEGSIQTARMNYMMVYDAKRQVFFLVTGNWNEAPIVWTLRLDPGKL